ncbi:glycosyl hydrolase family 28-related protein [Cytophagaceae bacterium YF14B1]|uniref:Glycosyl hydrolase family 28-related protein n=1 Tax=Xanthocytophaga flava TaxID=3048013 RepID=A0AAE3UAR7_9BACT|nr:glycosyl hydrolase family 28-related protein [Xanthocytophaga flavus]MDJ1484997.1 glycosyl hydrolase family 28-related protein [Xanthocytophaga flavus]
MPTNYIYILIGLLLSLQPETSAGQAYPSGEKHFPATAVINVREKYGAKGDGSTDDTQAIQQAISENIGKDRTLYFPKGTYLVTQPIKWVHIVEQDSLWRARLTIQGQSQKETIIRLKDHLPEFSNPETPKACLATGSNKVNNKESKNGGGINAFNNLIYDLTIHTGNGNPGAVALDFVGTNLAGLRNVTIVSGDGEGVAGILLKRQGAGPCLFKNVTIRGFDYGIDVYGSEYSQTYEYITLKDQKKASIRNTSNVLSLRKIRSENKNAVPVILNARRKDLKSAKRPDNYGLITLLDAEFVKNGEPATISAIVNESDTNTQAGNLYIRNVGVKGYQRTMENQGAVAKGSAIKEFVSTSVNGSASGNRADKPETFSLSIKETPQFHQNDLTQWASVTDFGASADDPNGDDTQAIQEALNSGKEVIFFPKGKFRYVISKTLVIKGNVRQLIGMQSGIDIGGKNDFSDSTQIAPVFRFEQGKHDTIYFERFNLSDERKSPFWGGVFIEHASSQVLVVKDIDNDVYARGKYFYQNTKGAGDLFLENVATIMPWNFAYAQHVWARQLNPEAHFVPLGKPIITQKGGSLWILGLKTEGPRTVLESDQGSVEVLGGFLYPVKNIQNRDLPAFISNKAKLKLTYVVNAYNPAASYTSMVSNGNKSSRKSITTDKKQFSNRGAGTAVPLYITTGEK